MLLVPKTGPLCVRPTKPKRPETPSAPLFTTSLVSKAMANILTADNVMFPSLLVIPNVKCMVCLDTSAAVSTACQAATVSMLGVQGLPGAFDDGLSRGEGARS